MLVGNKFMLNYFQQIVRHFIIEDNLHKEMWTIFWKFDYFRVGK